MCRVVVCRVVRLPIINNNGSMILICHNHFVIPHRIIFFTATLLKKENSPAIIILLLPGSIKTSFIAQSAPGLNVRSGLPFVSKRTMHFAFAPLYFVKAPTTIIFPSGCNAILVSGPNIETLMF